MILLCAFAKVRGCPDLVIVQGVDMERAFCIFSDGTIASVPLEDVRLTSLEAAARFSDLQLYNQNVIEEAREHRE